MGGWREDGGKTESHQEGTRAPDMIVWCPVGGGELMERQKVAKNEGVRPAGAMVWYYRDGKFRPGTTQPKLITVQYDGMVLES